MLPHEDSEAHHAHGSSYAMASSVDRRIVKQMAETSFSETDAKAGDETLAELERWWIFRDDAPDLGKVLLAKRFGLAQWRGLVLWMFSRLEV